MLGKYAAYIVPAFALTGAVFALMTAAALLHARRWRRRYEELSAKDDASRGR